MTRLEATLLMPLVALLGLLASVYAWIFYGEVVAKAVLGISLAIIVILAWIMVGI